MGNNAIFEFTDKSYIVAWWFAPMPLGMGDILACLYRESERWRLTMRMRYTRDDKVWDSADSKHVTEMESPADYTEARALAKADDLFNGMGKVGLIDASQMWRREVRGDGVAASKALASAPFASVKMVEGKAPSND